MRLRLIDRHIVIDELAPGDDQFVGSLPAVRWVPSQGVYRMPATPACAGAVTEQADACAGNVGIHNLMWANISRALINQRPPLTEPDYDYHTTPWAHQIEATRFARDMDVALLHCWMGTGKTKITLDAARARGHMRILVTCPKSVIPVWVTEIEKHAPGEYTVLPLDSGSVAKRSLALQKLVTANVAMIAVLNYEATWQPAMAPVLLSSPWDCVVWDECHRLKSAGSKQSKFAARLRAPHKLALTGTPMPHSPLDLYGQYRALDVGVFGGSFARFKQEYAHLAPIPGAPRGALQVVGFKNQDKLKAQMDRLAHHVPKDALDLPPIQFHERYCDLSGAARKVYRSLEREFIAEVGDGIVTAGNALTKLLRLQQTAAGFAKCEDGEIRPVNPRRADGTVAPAAKETLLAELLESMGSEKAVVFCRFHHDLDTVARVCKELGRTCGEISGRVKQYAEWKAGEFSTLAVQIQAGGLGIDLTEAPYAVYYTIGFSLGDYVQSVARVHRPGQTKAVSIYRLVVRDTVDEQLIKALDKKQNVIRAILEGVKGDG